MDHSLQGGATGGCLREEINIGEVLHEPLDEGQWLVEIDLVGRIKELNLVETHSYTMYSRRISEQSCNLIGTV